MPADAKLIQDLLARILHVGIENWMLERFCDRKAWRWMGTGSNLAILDDLGTMVRSPVVVGGPTVGGIRGRCLWVTRQSFAKRRPIARNSSWFGQAEESFKLTRRVLRITTAPIFNSFRRIVEH